MASGTNQKQAVGGNGAVDVAAVMAEFESPLLRYTARLLNNAALAQDVVQETFISLLRATRAGMRPDGSLSAWLHRVAHNLAVDHIRSEERRRTLHEKQAREAAPAAPPSQRRELEQAELLRLTLACVQQLDPAERQVAILRLQEGRSYKEISAITGRSEGNVGCLLHHAVRHVSEELKKIGAI